MKTNARASGLLTIEDDTENVRITLHVTDEDSPQWEAEGQFTDPSEGDGIGVVHENAYGRANLDDLLRQWSDDESFVAAYVDVYLRPSGADDE